MIKLTLVIGALFIQTQSLASTPKSILVDESLLMELGIEPLAVEPYTSVALAEITAEQEVELTELSHSLGRCGGFESLPEADLLPFQSWASSWAFAQLASQHIKNQNFKTPSITPLELKPEILKAVNQVSPEALRQTVSYLSDFINRDHKKREGQQAIIEFYERTKELLKDSSWSYEISLISHKSTDQKSIRVRLLGRERPEEVIVMGAHIDSISRSWFGGGHAPGADDNASGSANILEALRVLSNQTPTARSLDFFWYAGEEGGLLGSAEIATDYRNNKTEVIAVLQLDMTLAPGDGKDRIGSMTDFTSAWLRNELRRLNQNYLGVEILEDQCGYGCSDHASWHRQGYPTLMLSEARYKKLNRNLHTKHDLIDEKSDFEHSAHFSKLAVALALDLGNSTAREQN